MTDGFREDVDDIAQNYGLSRQLAHEFYSPGVVSWRNSFVNQKPPKGFVERQQFKEITGETVEEAEKEGLEEPFLDPTAAAAGGFGAVTKMSLSQGMKLMPSLGKGIVAGTVGAISDYPLGAATEVVEEKSSALALPFNVIAGMITGAAFDDLVIKGAEKGLKKAGIAIDIASDEFKSLVSKIRSGLEGNIAPEGDDSVNTAYRAVVETINNEIGAIGDIDQIRKRLEKAKDPKAELAKIKTEQQRITKKKILVSIGARKSTDVKASQLEVEDLKSLEIPDKAININFQNIESVDDVKKIITRVSEIYKPEIQEARRGVVSNKATQQLANLYGLSPEQLLKRRRGQAFNAHEALSARRILVSSAENVHSLAQRLQTLDATDADKFEFRRALNLHYAIQAQVSGLTAEAGRALQAFKIIAGSAESKTRAIKELLKTMPGDITIEDMAAGIAAMDSAEGVSTVIPKILRATTKDMFLEAWINALLSGPHTHMINTVSNSLNAFWQVPERFLAGMLGRVLPGEQVIKETEALQQAFGLIEGFKDGLIAFGKVARTGMPTDELTKLEAARYKAITAGNVRELPLIKKMAPNALQEGGMAARSVDVLGEIVRVPGRFLMAEDELFKSIGYRMELRAQAFRTVQQEGLTGSAAAKRLHEIMSDPETFAPNVHAAAIDASRYATFTNPLESKLLGALSSSKNPVIKLIVPFVRTPTNILKYGFERTPFAPLSSRIRSDISAGGARRDLALARMSLGSMIMSTAAVLSAQGMITGGGPSDPKLQANLRRQGWQPYSVKIGDKYVKYGRLEPLGILFGLAADFSEITGMAGEELTPEMDKMASAIIMSISKNVTSKTWLRGISETIKALEDPDRYGNRYVQNYAKTLTPRIVAQVERTIDPEVEAIYGLVDAMKSGVPDPILETFGMEPLPTVRRDLWGEKITHQIGVGKRSWAEAAFTFMSPIYISEGKDSPIDKELTRLKLGLSKPTRKQSILGVPMELTPEMYDDFMVMMNKKSVNGKDLKQSLNELIKTPEYKKLSPDGKKEQIRNRMNTARKVGRKRLIEKYPQLVDVSVAWKQRLVEGVE